MFLLCQKTDMNRNYCLIVQWSHQIQYCSPYRFVQYTVIGNKQYSIVKHRQCTIVKGKLYTVVKYHTVGTGPQSTNKMTNEKYNTVGLALYTHFNKICHFISRFWTCSDSGIFYVILLVDFGPVPTVWYFLFVILLVDFGPVPTMWYFFICLYTHFNKKWWSWTSFTLVFCYCVTTVYSLPFTIVHCLCFTIKYCLFPITVYWTNR
jgi:hypothetical protein